MDIKTITCICLLTFAVSAMSTKEKSPFTQEYTISNEQRGGGMSGNLDGLLTFDRQFGDGTSGGSCDYVGQDSSNDGVAYAVFPFFSPSGQMADLEVQLNTLGDSVLFIYCSFDPLNPADNLVAINDDGGVDFGSAISPADMVQLDPQTTYYAVVTGFSLTDLSTFNLVLGGDLQFGEAVDDDLIFSDGFEATPGL